MVCGGQDALSIYSRLPGSGGPTSAPVTPEPVTPQPVTSPVAPEPVTPQPTTPKPVTPKPVSPPPSPVCGSYESKGCYEDDPSNRVFSEGPKISAHHSMTSMVGDRACLVCTSSMRAICNRCNSERKTLVSALE